MVKAWQGNTGFQSLLLTYGAVLLLTYGDALLLTYGDAFKIQIIVLVKKVG